jgi:hypothetical protein
VSHANTHKPSAYPVFNRVVDSYSVRLYKSRRPSEFLLERLETWRDSMKEFRPVEQRETVNLPGIGQFIVWRSKRVYEFELSNPRIGSIHIWNPDKWHSDNCTETGQLHVDFRSPFLQAGSPTAAIRLLEALEEVLFSDDRLPVTNAPEGYWKLSRVDIAVDYARPEGSPGWASLEDYVSRASNLKTEGYLSPLNGDPVDNLREVIKYVSEINAKRRNTVRDAQNNTMRGGQKNDGFRASAPGPDNKGGSVYTHHVTDVREGTQSDDIPAPDFSTFDMPNGDAAQAAAFLLEEFSRSILASLASENTAQVSRALARSGKLESVYFGRFGGKLYLREYNKLVEINRSKKLYMLDVWTAAGWDGLTPVWRAEFSLAGEFLKEFIDTTTGERLDFQDPRVFQAHFAKIWAYLTRTWLRHCIPNPHDDNRSRWEPSERWQAIQNAWTVTDRLVRQPRPPEPTAEALIPQVRGCLKTMAAMLTGSKESPGGDEAQAWAKEKVKGWLDREMFGENRVLDFDLELGQRRIKLGYDDYSDASMTAMFRAERMWEGLGS